MSTNNVIYRNILKNKLIVSNDYSFAKENVNMDSNKINHYQFIGRKDQQANINIKGDLFLDRLKSCPNHKNILVDFDDTLFLKNSTELFISQAQPYYILSIIFQIFDVLKPWKLGAKKGEDISVRRDIFRLKFVLLFAPWSKKKWLKNARSIAHEYINYPLLNELSRSENSIYIITYGYDFIITPLLKPLEVDWPLLIVSNTKNISENRKKGKANIIEEKLGSETWDDCVCITDSELDSDVLNKCSEPYLVEWENGQKQVRAGLSPMLPFVYTKKVKRPTEKYFTRAIIGHDYLTLIIVFGLYSTQPFLTMLALFFFLLAYFSVYEIGYYENDKLGLLYEENPKVGKEFHKYAHHFKSWHAWLFGMIFTFIASYIAVSFKLSWLLTTDTFTNVTNGGNFIAELLLVFLCFMGLLSIIRLVFYWFNRIAVVGRIVPMFILQLARTASYLIIFSTNIIGAVFLFTHAVSKWIPYSVYRFGGKRSMVPNHLINFMLLAAMLLILFAIQDYKLDTLIEPVSIIVITYSLLRALKDIYKFRKDFANLKPNTETSRSQSD